MGDPSTSRQLYKAGKARAGTWLLGGVLTLGVTGAIAAVANWWEKDAIESDLTQRSVIALQESGMAPDGVSFEGRDATLYGSLAMEPNALAAVRDVEGVRSVTAGSTRSNYQVLAESGDNRKGVSSALAGRALSTAALRAQVNKLQTRAPIRFAPNSTVLSPQALDTVGKIAGLLGESPDARLQVAGHAAGYTDASEEDVDAAAQGRADAVYAELVKLGVPADRMYAEGYSDSTPPAVEATSRRVEIIVQ